MSNALLDGLRVLEVGDEAAIRFCGWMFAMNGAEVLRVQDRAEGTDPLVEGFLNSGKQITHAAPDSREWDIVIADPSYDWSQVPPQTISGTVHPFRPTGPYRDWSGSELVYCSLGGATGYTVSRDGTPVYGYGDRYQYIAGMHLFQGVTGCYLKTLVNETAQFDSVPVVEVSNFETVATSLPYPTTQYQYNGDESVLEQSGPRFVSRCIDGFVVIYGGFAWDPIAALLDRPDLLDDERFVDNGERFRHVSELGEIFDAWAIERSVTEACEIGKLQNVAVTPVRTPRQALHDEGLASRGAWMPDATGEGRVPLLPYTVDGVRQRPLAEGVAR